MIYVQECFAELDNNHLIPINTIDAARFNPTLPAPDQLIEVMARPNPVKPRILERLYLGNHPEYGPCLFSRHIGANSWPRVFGVTVQRTGVAA